MSANSLLAKLDDGGKSVRYIDLTPIFVQSDGTVSKVLMPDFFHFSDAGYQAWADAVAKPLAEMMGEK